MSNQADRMVQRVAGLIERYVALHPAAADTDKGIAQWWLPAMGIEPPVEAVRAALAWLVGRGVLERTQLPGGPAMYSARSRGRLGPPGPEPEDEWCSDE